MKFRNSAVIVLLSLAGCGGEQLPTTPQISVDRDTLGFGTEFNNATYIGTAPQETVMIENKGLNELVIAGVDKSGDSAFTFDGPAETNIKGKGRTFIRVIFTPTAAKTYAGSLTIRSNAENNPAVTVQLAGKGVNP